MMFIASLAESPPKTPMWQRHNAQLANFNVTSLRVTWFRWGNGVANCVWRAVPQPTERRIGNQIDAALVFARADFVNVREFSHRLIAL
jgi:hypothetical protein